MTRSNVESINQDCFVAGSDLRHCDIGGGSFSCPRVGANFSASHHPGTAVKKGLYLQEQCREIGERPDNKLQNVTSYKTLKRAVNSSVTLHPVLYYLDTFIGW